MVDVPQYPGVPWEKYWEAPAHPSPLFCRGADSLLLAEDKVTIFSGASGVGKTLLLGHLALALATGRPWLGLKPSLDRPIRVAYIDLEMGARTFLGKMRAVMSGMGMTEHENPPTFRGYTITDDSVIPLGFHLGKDRPEVMDRFSSWLRGMLGSFHPDIVCAEPLLDLMGEHLDINNPIHVNAFMRGLRIQWPFQWMLIHHEVKDPTLAGGGKRAVQHRLLGSVAIEKQADRTVSLVRDPEDGLIELQWGKVRNAQPPENFKYRLTERDDGAAVMEMARTKESGTWMD